MYSNPHTTPVERSLLKWASFVPFVALVVIVAVSIANMLPARTLRWGGLSLVPPIKSESQFPDLDNNELVFETQGPTQIVRAALSGTISLTPEGLVMITDGSVVLQYRGITIVGVAPGQKVVKGDPIGSVDANQQDSTRGRLRLKLLENGRSVAPSRG
jgi:magnesium-transporting ATPase (P-type)